MDQQKGKATFKVTYDLIAQALCLPDGTEITRIVSTPDSSIFCTFVVKHTDFPSDDHILVKPKFRLVSQSVVEFDGWGIEE